MTLSIRVFTYFYFIMGIPPFLLVYASAAPALYVTHTYNACARSYFSPAYSMFPIKRTVFLCTVTVHKNTVRLIGNIEYPSLQ